MRFLAPLSLLITCAMAPSSLGTDSSPEPPPAAPTQPNSPAPPPNTVSVASTQGLLEVHNVRNLDDLLDPIRITHRVPALGCAVIVSNRLAGLGAVGLRKSDDPSAPVTPDDRWHHGSLTKSMTATLAAILVQRGVLQWESTLEELFPSLAPSMKPAWRSVRLDWLCSNRSGAPGDLGAGGLWLELVRFQGTPFEGRRRLLERLTQTDPVHTPGTAYEYSNAGFALAGHMLETATGKPWETLMTENLFQPLGMTSAGFGAPGKPGQLNQPWGHQRLGDRNVPIEPGPSADNPPAIGPAGTMHGSLLDLSQYAAFHLRGHRADTPMLTREAMVRLHTAVPGNEGYGGGWIVTTRPWANGLVLTHSGSNRQWYSVLWLAPERQFAVAATCNVAAPSGPNPGAAATEQVVSTLIRTFLPQERPGSGPPPTPQ
ncbi:MAG: beta-lactamase family protein [Verrucomicrobiales bacterium]|nr:beta-lactamase family protein [Verrucomicrobiales bacterium]